MITVYLSDNRLQAVSGSGRGRATVSRCAVLPGLGDCLYGGAVTDREEFIRRVSHFLTEEKLTGEKIGLVLGSSQIISRIVKAPAGSEEKTLAYVANEFSDVDHTEDSVYAYSVLSENRKFHLNQILAVMADGKFLAEFVQLFEACGVTVASVRPAVDCVLRALGGQPVRGRTCLVQLRESAGFRDYLFVGGVYTYSSSHRIFAAPDSPEISEETARAVSNVIQFMQAQRIEGRLESVLLTGFTDTEAAASAEAIRGMHPEVKASPLPLENIARNSAKTADAFGCLCAVGDLAAGKGDCNLLVRPKKKKSTSGMVRSLLAATLAVCLVGGGVIGALLFRRADLRAKLEASRAYCADTEVLAQDAYADELLATQQTLNQREAAIARLGELLAGYPLPDSAVNTLLAAAADGLVTMEITQYESSTGILSLSTEAAYPERIPRFIQALRTQPGITVLEYSGYEYIDQRDVYGFSVTIRLTAEAGREAAE